MERFWDDIMRAQQQVSKLCLFLTGTEAFRDAFRTVANFLWIQGGVTGSSILLI